MSTLLHHRPDRKRALALAVVISWAAACGSSSGGATSVAEDARFFTDDQGRVLILHGANVASSAKTSPDRMPDITEDEIHLLSKEWGFNYVRYLLSWDGAEPQPGVYDETYFQGVEKRLDWLQAAGIHVMLDLHQDVYSTFTCGNGAPEWAVRTDGIPLEQPCRSVWSFNYFQPAVTRAFDNFWNGDSGAHPDLQQHFVAMWRAVAERFRDHPAVIGYDILNEPYPGSYFDKVEAALRRSPKDGAPSAAFDVERFAPFYQRTIDAIREVDDRHWIFFEPRFGAAGNGSPSWIPRLDDPRRGAPRIAYGPHLYSAIAEAANVDFPWNQTLAAWEHERTVDVDRQGCPLVIGEFGFTWAMTDAPRYMTELLDMADRMMAGWAYWAWDPGGPTSWAFYDRATRTPNPNSKYLGRPYPQRVAGVPTSYRFDHGTRVLELAFTERRGVTGPTELYVGAHRTYPDGWHVESNDPTGSWESSWDPDREVVTITTRATGGEHVVRILPGNP
jgi:endoglycosylceramidase